MIIVKIVVIIIISSSSINSNNRPRGRPPPRGPRASGRQAALEARYDVARLIPRVARAWAKMAAEGRRALLAAKLEADSEAMQKTSARTSSGRS